MKSRSPLIASALLALGFGRTPAVAATTAPTKPNRLINPNMFRPASPQGHSPKDWGMSGYCARMVRKNRMIRAGIAASKI